MSGNTNNTKQAAWISLGSLVSFSFGIISSMILSRYLDKADYGTYKQVLYVYNTLLIVFTLGLPRAYTYFLPRVHDDQAKHLIKKLTRLLNCLGGIFSLLLFIFAGQIALQMNNIDLEIAIRIFAIVPFLMLPTMGLEGIMATYKKADYIALYTIITRVFMLICVVAPVLFFDMESLGAIYGFVLSSVISFLIAEYLKYKPIKSFGNDSCPIKYRDIFKFSLPLLTASLWTILIKSTDQFFISRYFGNECFADYSNGSIELPFVGMLIGACSTVLSPIFSKLSSREEDVKDTIVPLWLNVFKKTVMLIYPMVLYCMFFSDEIMILLYGSNYEISVLYFKIRLFTNFFTIISFAPLIINTGYVKFYSNMHMVCAICILSLQVLFINLYPSPYMISIITVLCHIMMIVYGLWFIATKIFKSRISDVIPFATMLKILVSSFIILYLIRSVVVYFELNSILSIIIGLVGYLILYLPVSYILKLDYFGIVKSIRQ